MIFFCRGSKNLWFWGRYQEGRTGKALGFWVLCSHHCPQEVPAFCLSRNFSTYNPEMLLANTLARLGVYAPSKERWHYLWSVVIFREMHKVTKVTSSKASYERKLCVCVSVCLSLSLTLSLHSTPVCSPSLFQPVGDRNPCSKTPGWIWP